MYLETQLCPLAPFRPTMPLRGRQHLYVFSILFVMSSSVTEFTSLKSVIEPMVIVAFV